MYTFFLILILLWAIRTTRAGLFYTYLWQLKEYHIRRFVDHFRTEKGKRLLLNELIILKLLILVPFLLTFLSSNAFLEKSALLVFIIFILIIIYAVECFFTAFNIFRRKLKVPTITFKSALLIAGFLIYEFAVVFYLVKGNLFLSSFILLLLDVLNPLIASFIVLLLQPFTVLIRLIIIMRAKSKRAKFKDLKVIGITGSYGKTSTKEFLSVILSKKFKVLKTSKHQNSEMGISRCILNDLNKDYSVFVAEMGAYVKGGIKLLSGIVKPQIGVITGINEQHMALFGSQENIVKTKYELIENLPQDGLAVFNGDNKYCRELYNKTKINKKIYKTEKNNLDADVWAEDIVISNFLAGFKVKTKTGESADLKVIVFGRHNIPNLLACITVAMHLGMSLNEIANACLDIREEHGSMRLLKGKEDPFVIDATYSTNSDGVIADLEYLEVWPKKKIIVMPCLIELGEASQEVHQRIGKKIGETCDLAIITTEERFNDIKKGANEMKNILFISDPDKIADQIKKFSSPGDVVLLEGRVPNGLIERL